MVITLVSKSVYISAVYWPIFKIQSSTESLGCVEFEYMQIILLWHHNAPICAVESLRVKID